MGETIVQLKVAEAGPRDVGRGIARIDPEMMEKLGVADPGEVIKLVGRRETVAKVMPTFPEFRGQGIIQIDGIIRENAQAGIDEKARLNKVEVEEARKVTLSPLTLISGGLAESAYLSRQLSAIPMIAGDRVQATFLGTRKQDFKVISTVPGGAVILTPQTSISMTGEGKAQEARLTYEDIGGLGEQMKRIREMIELPLRFPQVFARLGVEPPKGVLLYGPPGCIVGDSLIALENGALIRIEELAQNLFPGIYVADLPIYPPASTKAIHVYDVPETIEIVTETGKRLRTTLNHPVMTKKGWKEAEKLERGEMVQIFRWLPSPHQHIPVNFNIDYRRVHIKIPLPKFWDEDLGEIFGIFIAEGTARERRVFFTIEKYEEELANLLMKKMKSEFNIDGKVFPKKGKKCQVLRFENRALCDFFSQYWSKEEKRVPSPILMSPNSVGASFIRGLFEGDGYVRAKPVVTKKEHGGIYLKNKSRKLLEEVQILLLRFSIASRIYENKYKTKKGIIKKIFLLSIRGKENVLKYRDNIGFISKRKNEKLLVAARGYKRNLRYLYQKGDFERTVSIKKLYGWQRVYDFEIPTTHSFFSNGILSHNTGKTLIARVIANETDAYFLQLSGPQVMHKFYGESEAHLRSIFEEAKKNAPAILFLDELDAIAPKREELGGEKQVERRVVATLLAEMDGLESRGELIVIGATNLPNILDPALRRPGRFDREIVISIPDKNGRLEILQIHTRGMPLAGNIDLEKLAFLTHGFVGADLAALCREAAMYALRRLMPKIDFEHEVIPQEALLSLEVTMDDFLNALREIEPSAIREVFTEIPEVTFEDIGGLEDIKQVLYETICEPLYHPEVYAKAKTKPAKGILLTGEPGTGKTLLAKAIANEAEVNFISIKGPELLSKYIGESERGVREVFKKAKQAAPCILFFDEIESLIPKRGKLMGEQVTERVISQFLTEMDGIEELKGVVILASTNRPDLLDPALLRPGRFDFVLELPKPDEKEREEIFKIHTEGKSLDKNVNLKELVKETEGLVGSDIASICQKASLLAIREFLQTNGFGKLTTREKDLKKLKIKKKHFMEAMKKND